MKKHYGYGIVDKDGNPHWDEDCVCIDPEPMQDKVRYMNDGTEIFDEECCAIGHEPPAPYRVVKLYWEDEA